MSTPVAQPPAPDTAAPGLAPAPDQPAPVGNPPTPAIQPAITGPAMREAAFGGITLGFSSGPKGRLVHAPPATSALQNSDSEDPRPSTTHMAVDGEAYSGPYHPIWKHGQRLPVYWTGVTHTTDSRPIAFNRDALDMTQGEDELPRAPREERTIWNTFRPIGYDREFGSIDAPVAPGASGLIRPPAFTAGGAQTALGGLAPGASPLWPRPSSGAFSVTPSGGLAEPGLGQSQLQGPQTAPYGDPIALGGIQAAREREEMLAEMRTLADAANASLASLRTELNRLEAEYSTRGPGTQGQVGAILQSAYSNAYNQFSVSLNRSQGLPVQERLALLESLKASAIESAIIQLEDAFPAPSAGAPMPDPDSTAGPTAGAPMPDPSPGASESTGATVPDDEVPPSSMPPKSRMSAGDVHRRLIDNIGLRFRDVANIDKLLAPFRRLLPPDAYSEQRVFDLLDAINADARTWRFTAPATRNKNGITTGGVPGLLRALISDREGTVATRLMQSYAVYARVRNATLTAAGRP